MLDQYRNLTQGLSTEVAYCQNNLANHELKLKIEEIISANGNANDGIIDYKLFAADLSDFINTLPSNLVNELKIVKNLSNEVLNFKENTQLLVQEEEEEVEVNVDDEEKNYINYTYVPSNIES